MTVSVRRVGCARAPRNGKDFNIPLLFLLLLLPLLVLRSLMAVGAANVRAVRGDSDSRGSRFKKTLSMMARTGARMMTMAKVTIVTIAIAMGR